MGCPVRDNVTTMGWPVAGTVKPVDWPTPIWREVASARSRVDSAVAALENLKEQQRRKHIRANRMEAAYDDVVFAEREFVMLQRDLGLHGTDLVPHDQVVSALEVSSASSCEWLLLLGARLSLPSDPWGRVLSSLLPVKALGYDHRSTSALRLCVSISPPPPFGAANEGASKAHSIGIS